MSQKTPTITATSECLLRAYKWLYKLNIIYYSSLESKIQTFYFSFYGKMFWNIWALIYKFNAFDRNIYKQLFFYSFYNFSNLKFYSEDIAEQGIIIIIILLAKLTSYIKNILDTTLSNRLTNVKRCCNSRGQL